MERPQAAKNCEAVLRATLDGCAAARDNGARPQVTLTFAQSLDGCITRVPGQPTSISCTETFQMTHLLRAWHDCILVGVNTVIADNPSLSTRLVQGPTPQPVILDSSLRLPLNCKLLNSPECIRPWVFTCNDSCEDRQAWATRRQQLLARGALVLDVASRKGKVDLTKVLELVWEMGKSSVMIEGGAGVIHAILTDRSYSMLVNSVLVTVAPRFFGGLHYIHSLLPQDQSLEWKIRATQLVGTDVVLDMCCQTEAK